MAQKRRKERMMKRRQRRITALCIAGGIGAMLLSLVICLLLFDIGGDEVAVSAPASTALPYDATQPFSISDLTAQQLTQIRSEGRISVSDGPRGVSVGDTLDEMLTHFPSSYTGAQPSEDEQILYCADYYENQNGIMTVLPPRGLMTVESRNIVVTLLAPTSAYPAGTRDQYGDYEHVYCIFTIEPESMTISRIELGIDQ
ncbi:MAG TPA: hypothetical protein IAC19_04990 [Candidatus Ventricola gallistercoris]|nr:hypothetical protein [Candidatus Ventricola gallistercoris]